MSPVKKNLQIVSRKKTKSSRCEQKHDLPDVKPDNSTHLATSLEMLMESQTNLLGDALAYCRMLIQKAEVQLEEIMKYLYDNEEEKSEL